MALRRWLSVLLTALCAALVSGCDRDNFQSLQPGVSTKADVQARFGRPSAEYSNDDETVTWEYNRQPNGIECHMITFDRNQLVMNVEQVLTEANFAKIQANMGKDEVLRLLGHPGSANVFERVGEEVWDWRVAGDVPLEEAHFHVHFDARTGLVKKTSRHVEQKR